MTYDLKKASVLVVDDMLPMLTLVDSLLKIFGFKDVYKTTDPEQAFKLFCEHNPDLVLTDWLMEPFDGVELVRRIRTDTRSPNRFVPIIMMTGYSHKIRVIQSRDCGVTEFLVKPFRAKDLYARIEQLIEKPRKFVDAENFFGPDRRRKRDDGYDGSKRREADEFQKMAEENREGAKVLRDLQKQAKQAARPAKDSE